MPQHYEPLPCPVHAEMRHGLDSHGPNPTTWVVHELVAEGPDGWVCHHCYGPDAKTPGGQVLLNLAWDRGMAMSVVEALRQAAEMQDVRGLAWYAEPADGGEGVWVLP